MHEKQVASCRTHVQAQNFSRLAFHHNLKGTAANFAIGDEALRAGTGINHAFHCLAAERALEVSSDLHIKNLPHRLTKRHIKFMVVRQWLTSWVSMHL